MRERKEEEEDKKQDFHLPEKRGLTKPVREVPPKGAEDASLLHIPILF